MTLEKVIRRAFEPTEPADAPFAAGWDAGVLYTGGWTFGVARQEMADIPGDYAVTAVDETKMRRLRPPTDIHEQFANLATLQESYELSQALVDATIAISGHRPAFTQYRVQPNHVQSFLLKYGPLSDSFLRDGMNPVDERERCANRDPRGATWAYTFNEPLRVVANIFDLSGRAPDEALEIALLFMDVTPQATLLKAIAVNVLADVLDGRDMTRCENPNCRRYFRHVRVDQLGCSNSCASVIRQRRKREKDRSVKRRKSTKGD